jgi:hypothetical protein
LFETSLYIYILLIYFAGKIDHQFTGDLDAVTSALQRSRDSMRDVLQLTELPEIDQEESDVLKHMRIQQLVSRCVYQ